MDILKDLPPGTIWPHLLTAIQRNVDVEIKAYSQSRQNNVTAKKETAKLAAVMVEKYAAGMAKALHIVGIDTDITKVADTLVREIDPNFDAHKAERWKSLADLHFVRLRSEQEEFEVRMEDKLNSLDLNNLDEELAAMPEREQEYCRRGLRKIAEHFCAYLEKNPLHPKKGETAA